MTETLNLRHAVFFFGLVALVVNIPIVRTHAFPLGCLILVCSLGTSHGALDYLKGRQILKGMSRGSMIHFYLLYVAVALGTIACWFWAPSLLMVMFLVVACFHFGKEDSGPDLANTTLRTTALFTLKGSVIVAAPLLFHQTETLELLQLLGLSVSGEVAHGLLAVILFGGWVATGAVGWKAKRPTQLMLQLDFFAVLFLNAMAQPLLAFTIYFCFLHSVRHSLETVGRLDRSRVRGVVKFVRGAWFLTVVVAVIFGAVTAHLLSEYSLGEASSKVIFLGLASLTFPHIILEHLHEKGWSDSQQRIAAEVGPHTYQLVGARKPREMKYSAQ